MDDVYMGRSAALLEIKVDRALKLIGDDNRTRVHFLSGLRTHCDAIQAIEYCKNFVLDLDKHRVWAEKNLWFIEPTVG